MRNDDADDEDDTEDAPAAGGPEYEFDGYDMVFSEKVALTPPQPRRP